MTIEYRVGWAATTNAMFRGTSDWTPWDDDEATADEVESALGEAHGGLMDGLEIALDASGFEWWVETREATA